MTSGESIGYRFLRRFFPRTHVDAQARSKKLKGYVDRISCIVGQNELELWRNKRVVDFGCGFGEGAIELTQFGIANMVGMDNRPEVLSVGRDAAEASGISDRCAFVTHLESESVDVIVSIDAFEHFGNLNAVLGTMNDALVPGGQVVASFGPTWYHPYGGHLFSVFPWAHLLLSESSLCQWRRDFRDDNASKFGEVDGGLGQLTIADFEKTVAQSPLSVKKIALRPIAPARHLHCRWTREALTSVVECVLEKPGNC